jgi:branched-chain amino acid transport system permease protein
MDIKAHLLKVVRSKKFLILLAAMILMAVLPLLARNEYIIGSVVTLMLVYAIYASSWNLLAYSGQGSLGHAAFLGIGAFASALFAKNLGMPLFLGLFVGALISAGIGFLIGLACVRLKAWFLAMVTFGFTVIILAIMSQFDSFFGGMIGFQTPTLFPQPQFFPLYYVTLAFTVASIVAIFWVMKSKFGLAFKAIRENESEAKMVGVNTGLYKLLAFVISTFFAGLAGGLYAQSNLSVHVSIFDPAFSFLPLIMAVIGGLATIEGPIIGSVVIVSINSFLPQADKYLQILHPLFPGVTQVGPQLREIFLGMFLILVVIFMPKGLTSLFQKTYRYLRKTGLRNGFTSLFKKSYHRLRNGNPQGEET